MASTKLIWPSNRRMSHRLPPTMLLPASTMPMSDIGRLRSCWDPAAGLAEVKLCCADVLTPDGESRLPRMSTNPVATVPIDLNDSGTASRMPTSRTIVPGPTPRKPWPSCSLGVAAISTCVPLRSTTRSICLPPLFSMVDLSWFHPEMATPLTATILSPVSMPASCAALSSVMRSTVVFGPS